MPDCSCPSRVPEEAIVQVYQTHKPIQELAQDVERVVSDHRYLDEITRHPGALDPVKDS